MMQMPQAPPPPPPAAHHPLDQHLPAHFENMSLHTDVPHFNPNHAAHSPVFDGHHNDRPQNTSFVLPRTVNPKEAVSYEGYILTKVVPSPGQAETWARIQKKPMKLTQKELYAEAKKQKNRGPSDQQMQGWKRKQIDHLIDERTRTDDDMRFEYTQASLKLNKNINSKGQPETKSMEAILKRSLRPGVVHAATMRGRVESGVEIVDLTRPHFDDGSSQESYPMSGNSFTGFHESPMMHGPQHVEPPMHSGPGPHMPVHPIPHQEFVPQHGIPEHGIPQHGHPQPAMHHGQFMAQHPHQYGFPHDHQHAERGEYPSSPEHHPQPKDAKKDKKDKKDKKKDSKKEHKGHDKHYEEYSDRGYKNRDHKDKKASKKNHKEDKQYDGYSDQSYDSSDVDSDTSYRTPATTISTGSSADYHKEKKYRSGRREKTYKSRDYERDHSPRRQIYRQHRRKSPARSPPVRLYRIDHPHYDDEEYDVIPGGAKERPHLVRRGMDYPQYPRAIDHHRAPSYDDDIYRGTRRSPPPGRRPSSIYRQQRSNPAPSIDLYHEDREHDDVITRELRREAAQRDRLREMDLREIDELRREKARRDDDLFRRNRMVRDQLGRSSMGERLPRLPREHDYYQN